MKKGNLSQAASITNRIKNIIINTNYSTLKNSRRGSKAMWNTVNKLRGKATHSTTNCSNNLDADSLNKYFASMSTTTTYVEPLLKSTVISHQHHLNSRTIYHLLTKHCPTGTGSDGLPQWYLQLIAPAISTPLSIIFNNCINDSFFPTIMEVQHHPSNPKN